MKNGLASLAAVVLLVGCKPSAPASPSSPPKPTARVAAQSSSGQGGDGATVETMGPNVGGITPVTGTDALQGSGSAMGPGEVMKERARALPGASGTPDPPPEQTPQDDH